MDTALAPQRPWWFELGSVLPRSVAYAAQATRGKPDRAVPSLSPSPLTFATVAMDEFAMAAFYLLRREGAMIITPELVAGAEVALERLRDAGVVDDPMLLHPRPQPPKKVRVTRRTKAGVEFEHVSFPSSYVPPADLPGYTAWRAAPANRMVHAYLRRHGDRPRPWLLVLHGHGMGEPRDLRLLGSVKVGRDLGIDIAHLVLTNHGPRGRGGADAFPGIDPVTNLLGMAQCASDARALLGWLRSEAGATRTGVYGISLGGHAAALVSSLDDDLSCVIAGIPVANFATMLEATMRARWGEETIAASHVLDEAPQVLSRLVSPLHFPSQVPRENRYIYAAVGDRLITPQQALLLWQHWDSPEIKWLQGGHILNNMLAARRFVGRALKSSGIVDR